MPHQAACSGEAISTHRGEPMARGELTSWQNDSPAYFRAFWPDVEDEVSLCVWVRKQCGEELTVKQAGRLRKAMEALMVDAVPLRVSRKRRTPSGTGLSA